MSDVEIRALKRRVEQGDDSARNALDLAQRRRGEDREQITALAGALCRLQQKRERHVREFRVGRFAEDVLYGLPWDRIPSAIDWLTRIRDTRWHLPLPVIHREFTMEDRLLAVREAVKMGLMRDASAAAALQVMRIQP